MTEASPEPSQPRKWSLDIRASNDGCAYAVLRESGKMDTLVGISEEQLPWFNALRNLLRGDV